MLFLPPGQSAFYTWIDPQGDRTLIWGHDLSKASHDFENLLVTDGQGLVDLGSNKCLAWVSFLDGMQRVLLFTEDADRCWRLTQNIGEIERIAMVIFTIIFYHFLTASSVAIAFLQVALLVAILSVYNDNIML